MCLWRVGGYPVVSSIPPFYFHAVVLSLALPSASSSASHRKLSVQDCWFLSTPVVINTSREHPCSSTSPVSPQLGLPVT